MIFTCGGFDILHMGHVELLRACHSYAAQGEDVVVALNSDAWIQAKKGYVVFSFADRRAMLLALRYVSAVVPFEGMAGGGETAALTLRKLRPRMFVKGGDRVPGNLDQGEIDACTEIGCVFHWGATPTRYSSSRIGAKIMGDIA